VPGPKRVLSRVLTRDSVLKREQHSPYLLGKQVCGHSRMRTNEQVKLAVLCRESPPPDFSAGVAAFNGA